MQTATFKKFETEEEAKNYVNDNHNKIILIWFSYMYLCLFIVIFNFNCKGIKYIHD